MDSTIKILESYKNRFQKFELIHGPQKGASANFFWLMQHASGQYFAFADQDDVWLPEHLSASLKMFDGIEMVPAMTYGSVLEFGEGLKSRVWPKRRGIKNLTEICFENHARGCTIVFNRSLLEIVNVYNPKRAVMHDWWVLLCACTYGRAIFLPNVTLHYRLHDANVIGRNQWKPFRGIRTILNGEWAPFRQLEDFDNFAQDFNLKIQNNEVLAIASNIRKFQFGAVFFSHKRFRSTYLGEFKLRLGLMVFGKRLLRVKNA